MRNSHIGTRSSLQYPLQSGANSSHNHTITAFCPKSASHLHVEFVSGSFHINTDRISFGLPSSPPHQTFLCSFSHKVAFLPTMFVAIIRLVSRPYIQSKATDSSLPTRRLVSGKGQSRGDSHSRKLASFRNRTMNHF
jgi:hypothetical protein